ncbi:EAL domain-containing protein [Enterobacter kobei]|uniref:EAL domain-containing protein n=1 Tax=Enterobacter kobei TaxID=208224 RepID=UPI0012544F34|nr:EAL domain-containing protein [Enterobacter kobei]VAL19153.1 diguanylate phosphodiesterase [Enterobacter kobei]
MKISSIYSAGLSALFFVCVMSSGIFIGYWQMQKTLTADVRTKLDQAVTNIDLTLSHAELAANATETLPSHSCNEQVLTSLRTIVATVPDIRTVNLARGNEIYCTSVFGGQHSVISRDDYTGGRLLLLSGNTVSPTRSLMVWRSTEKNGRYVLVGIDGYYLYNILRLLSGMTPMYLMVGSQLMSLQGTVSPSFDFPQSVYASSQKYPYSVIADRGALTQISTFWQYGRGPLIALFILSLLLTFLFHRYQQYRNTIESQLEHAIKRQQITPWMQPIISAKTGKIVGGEVLLRWEHSAKGFIPPDVFIPIAEQSGMIQALTRECFRQVITGLQNSGMLSDEPRIVCFNVSAAHFRNEEIVRLSHAFISAFPEKNWRLVLEITERDRIDASEQLSQTLGQLKKAGVQLSLDDFGTGNANYRYIQLFSPDYLKIDKAFTREICSDPVSTYVVESIVTLAAKAQCSIVAEGIEHEGQRERLLQMGVSHFQGYLFSRPLPLAAFLSVVEHPDGVSC